MVTGWRGVGWGAWYHPWLKKEPGWSWFKGGLRGVSVDRECRQIQLSALYCRTKVLNWASYAPQGTLGNVTTVT